MRTRPSLAHLALTIVGKLLLSMSIGVLLFLGWTLWGTKAAAQREQRSLATEFDEQEAFFKAEPGLEMPPLVPPSDYAPGIGKPLFRLRIPAMNLNEIVVEGVDTPQLDVAPGHYPTCRRGVPRSLCTPWESPFPGEPGRSVISGHRTTHGAPFWDLDVLDEGDRIITETRWGTFVYVVERTRIVPAESTEIVVQGEQSELVLTTCHPRFSAEQRLIVVAQIAEAAPPE